MLKLGAFSAMLWLCMLQLVNEKGWFVVDNVAADAHLEPWGTLKAGPDATSWIVLHVRGERRGVLYLPPVRRRSVAMARVCLDILTSGAGA